MTDQSLRDQLIQRLLAVSDAKLTATEVNDQTSFQDLDVGSLILVTLASELEHELGISIDDDELSRIRTIGDLLGVIESSQRLRRPA